MIGEKGATSLSDALKSNKTLIELYLGCKHKRNKTQIASNNNLIFLFIRSIGSNIGYIGATSMSEALKTNTTLAKLDLGCKHKRNKTQIASNNNIIFLLFQSIGNKIGKEGATSLSEALKSNPTLTQLDLGGTHKRNNTQMVS